MCLKPVPWILGIIAALVITAAPWVRSESAPEPTSGVDYASLDLREKSGGQQAEPNKQIDSRLQKAGEQSRADLDLVEQIFKPDKRRPMDWSESQENIGLNDALAWSSYWWDGDSALYNTHGLVITGRTILGERWKPYALLGLEEKVTYERYGTRRQGQAGVGLEFALSDQLALFTEIRAIAGAGLPNEGLARLGLHWMY